jgi:hypothetical protein
MSVESMSMQKEHGVHDGVDQRSSLLYASDGQKHPLLGLASLLFEAQNFMPYIAKTDDGIETVETIKHAVSDRPLFERRVLVDDVEGSESDENTRITIFPMGHGGAFGRVDVILTNDGIKRRESDIPNAKEYPLPDEDKGHLVRILMRLSGLDQNE